MDNFWRFLDLPLINCGRVLNLSLSKDCIFEISRTTAIAANPAVVPSTLTDPAMSTTETVFPKISTKRYVTIVIISINNNINFFQNLKQGFKRTTSWNKYRSKETTQPKSSSLQCMIDPTFRNINGLFVVLLRSGNYDILRKFFWYILKIISRN